MNKKSRGKKIRTLLSPSLLGLPREKSVNLRWGAGTRKGPYLELAGGEDRKLVSQSSHLVGGLGARFFYGSEIWGAKGRWGNKVKRPFNSCKYLLDWQASGRGTRSLHFLKSFHRWREMEHRLPYRLTRMPHLSVILASQSEFWGQDS